MLEKIIIEGELGVVIGEAESGVKAFHSYFQRIPMLF